MGRGAGLTGPRQQRSASRLPLCAHPGKEAHSFIVRCTCLRHMRVYRGTKAVLGGTHPKTHVCHAMLVHTHTHLQTCTHVCELERALHMPRHGYAHLWGPQINALLFIHAQACTSLHTQAGPGGDCGPCWWRVHPYSTLCILPSSSALGAEVSVGVFILWGRGRGRAPRFGCFGLLSARRGGGAP